MFTDFCQKYDCKHNPFKIMFCSTKFKVSINLDFKTHFMINSGKKQTKKESILTLGLLSEQQVFYL